MKPISIFVQPLSPSLPLGVNQSRGLDRQNPFTHCSALEPARETQDLVWEQDWDWEKEAFKYKSCLTNKVFVGWYTSEEWLYWPCIETKDSWRGAWRKATFEVPQKLLGISRFHHLFFILQVSFTLWPWGTSIYWVWVSHASDLLWIEVSTDECRDRCFYAATVWFC